MVMRSFATREMCLRAHGSFEEVKRRLQDEFGNLFDISFSESENEVCIRGDLHDYRLRNRIIRIVTGEKHGIDFQAGHA